jgi:hypothetical protein
MTKTVGATPAAAGHGPRMSDQLGGLIDSEHTHNPGRDQELRFHPLSELFPSWRAASSRSSSPTVKAHGLVEPIVRAVFAHLHARAVPSVFASHPANGGYRKLIDAAIMKGLGVVPGVPDVICFQEGRCYGVELKTEGGRASPKQLDTNAAMEAAGAYTCAAEGHDRALATLEAWGLLGGRAS